MINLENKLHSPFISELEAAKSFSTVTIKGAYIFALFLFIYLFIYLFIHLFEVNSKIYML